MQDHTPQAVQAAHELLVWLIPQLDKLPRARRFTLGERLEAGVLAVLERLIEAAYTRDKEHALQQANLRLDIVRHLWRAAHELQLIPTRRYEHGSRLFDDLGRQIGGCSRAAGQRSNEKTRRYLEASRQLRESAFRLPKSAAGQARTPRSRTLRSRPRRRAIVLAARIAGRRLRTYRLFTLCERKPRLIAAAPFRDRVVHHAVMNVIEPALDRTFIHDSYACRAGKGVHAAVARYQGWARRYAYVLKMDIAQYFPSVDHDLLRDKLRRRIKDKCVLALLDRIIDGSPAVGRALEYFPGDDLLTPISRRTGIPIGNLTSQFFANLYLDDFDHYAKEVLHCKAYLRYVDDTIVLDDDKAKLRELRAVVRERLARDRLRLHPRKVQVSRVSDGLALLGYLTYPRRRRLRNDNGHRFARRLRRMAAMYADDRLDWAAIDASIQSWIGHACHADAGGLRPAIFSRIIFRRGTDREATGV